MIHKNDPYRLAQFISYIIGRNPDEFGLVADIDGSFRIKDLLKVVAEEPGWGYVRQAHLREVILSVQGVPFEIMEDRIRALETDGLPHRRIATELPKVLYTCVRQRAYPHVTEKGIFPTGHFEVVLSDDPTMAKRMGLRMDSEAVLLAVRMAACRSLGTFFFTAGQGLYTAGSIPAGCFTGPPLPKAPPVVKIKSRPKPVFKEPGSYFINLDDVADANASATGQKKREKNRNPKKGSKRPDRFDRERPPWRR